MFNGASVGDLGGALISSRWVRLVGLEPPGTNHFSCVALRPPASCLLLLLVVLLLLAAAACCRRRRRCCYSTRLTHCSWAVPT